jgi:hypothetical protein
MCNCWPQQRVEKSNQHSINTAFYRYYFSVLILPSIDIIFPHNEFENEEILRVRSICSSCINVLLGRVAKHETLLILFAAGQAMSLQGVWVQTSILLVPPLNQDSVVVLYLSLPDKSHIGKKMPFCNFQ